jgi:hypothetical protein
MTFRPIVIVLDLVTQVRDVVFVSVYLVLGNPRGSGFWNEGYMGDCFTNCIARRIFVYIVNACNCLNDCQSIYVDYACITIIGYECN